MKIKDNRLYPYPVLSEQLDDYIDNTFNVNMTIDQGIDVFTIKASVNITNSDMLKNIRLKNANVYMHVECSTTKYRDSFVIDNFDNYITSIDDSFLNGTVEVIFLIIASKEMRDFSSESLNGYYRQQTYDIPKSSMIGYSASHVFTVNKMLDSNGEIPSIFIVSQSSSNLMKIELNNEKIIIYLPQSSYETYEQMKSIHVKIKQLLINVGTLIYVFDELKKTPEDYEQFIWYIVIDENIRKLGQGFEEGVKGEKFLNTPSVEITQLIMKNIVNDGFQELKTLHEKYIDQEI